MANHTAAPVERHHTRTDRGHGLVDRNAQDVATTLRSVPPPTGLAQFPSESFSDPGTSSRQQDRPNPGEDTARRLCNETDEPVHDRVAEHEGVTSALDARLQAVEERSSVFLDTGEVLKNIRDRLVVLEGRAPSPAKRAMEDDVLNVFARETQITPRVPNTNRHRQGSSAQGSAQQTYQASRRTPPKPSTPIMDHAFGSKRPYVIDSSSDEEEQNNNVQRSNSVKFIPFHKRLRGPCHEGLEVIKPSDPRYDRLMSYRYYRLIDEDQQLRESSQTPLYKYLKELNLVMETHKFTGKDPILIFDFLTRYVEETDKLEMSEDQAFVLLPQFLSNPAAVQFRAVQGGSRFTGVTCWPEAVQHLLQTYATPSAIRNALRRLQTISQLPKETELEYSTRINEAVYRCGNVHDEVDKMTFFVNGLSPSIQTIV